MYFGSFIGPTVAGFLVDAYGFEWTTVLFFGLYCCIMIADLCELIYDVWQSKMHERMTNTVTKNI